MKNQRGKAKNVGESHEHGHVGSTDEYYHTNGTIIIVTTP